MSKTIVGSGLPPDCCKLGNCIAIEACDCINHTGGEITFCPTHAAAPDGLAAAEAFIAWELTYQQPGGRSESELVTALNIARAFIAKTKGE